MQNQTPTANLQALVPKFAARGQWFCKYFLTPASNSQLKQNSNNKYVRITRSTLKKTSTYKKNKSKLIKTPHQPIKERKHERPVHDSVHDALLTLKFCKAISSTCDENSTYHKNYNEKKANTVQFIQTNQMKSYDVTLWWKQEMQITPRESPPSPPPHDASHPPPAEMKYTWGAAVLVPDFATRWRARRKHLRKKIFSVATRRKWVKRKKATRLSPKQTPQHKSTQNQL